MRRFGLSEILLSTSIMVLAVPGLLAQSNILYNGSFEILSNGVPTAGWDVTGGVSGHVNEHGAAEGRCWLTSGTIAQDIATVAGRPYRIRFALSSASANVRWNGSLIGQPAASGGGWIYMDLFVVATGEVSRIGFEIGGALDDISVGWVEEPPYIVKAVPSRSVFEGGAVTFPVVAGGMPPYFYQWLFKDESIAGANSSTLYLSNLQDSSEGDYTVVVSNAFGTVSSLPASLDVRTIPSVPLIVHQPRDLQMAQGYNAGFYVFAISTQPLSYQWRFNGTNIPSATNSHYTIPSVSTNNVGSYSVMVGNQFGTALSYAATLAVYTQQGGGAVMWDNITVYDVYGIDARVFDVDGVTPLEGPDYVAQLYAGVSSNDLHAVDSPVPFFTEDGAGFYYGFTGVIPDVPAFQTAYLQIRVWDSSQWETFEEAAALGGKIGKSDIITKVLQPPVTPPMLTELWSYSLQAGSPLLAAAKLYPNPASNGNNREWFLVGEAGERYVVERRSPPNDWIPFLLVTNITGTVSFTDPEAANASHVFYRAQILE